MSKLVYPKTLAEHREYMDRMIRLEMFYAFLRHREAPEEKLEYIFRQRVNVVRFTTHYRRGMDNDAIYQLDQSYQSLEHGLVELLVRHEKDAASAQFEDAVSAYLRPELDANAMRHFEESLYIEPRHRCGFLHYDLTRYDDEFPGWMAFHIANDRMPYSFFEDPEHIRKSFEGVLDAAENLMKVDTIFCCSWLNSFFPWLALFPEEWKLDRGPENNSIEWHYGFWGQFINARGLFNERYGELFRKTGKLPFALRCAHCKVSAMREKLAAMSQN